MRSSGFSPKPDCRSTNLHLGRPVGRPKITESWALTVRELRLTGRSTASEPCACCACRPTRPVDRPAYFSAAAAISCCCSLRLRRRLPRRSLDDPSAILINFPISKLSLSNNSPPRRRFFLKSEPISNEPQSITWRNRHTISAKSTHDLGLRAPVKIDTRSRRNRHTISAWSL